jgi:hypothetical protein
LTSTASCMVVPLHYAISGESVKEMSRFRQIRRAGCVHDGGINAHEPVALVSMTAPQVVCAFSER